MSIQVVVGNSKIETDNWIKLENSVSYSLNICM